MNELQNLLQLRSLAVFDVGYLGVLTTLKGSDVGYDGPPVCFWHSMTIPRHISDAVGNGVEELAMWLCPHVVEVN